MRTFEQYISESRQNYVFGGTDDRNTEVGKTFGELEEGDALYYAVCDTRAEMNYALYYARQYAFCKREKDGGHKTKFFIKIKENTNNYFVIPNKDLDSTLTIIKTEDLCRHIISTDKDEFLEEVNKATNGKYSDKDIDIIE